MTTLREAADRVAAAWQREYLDRGPGEFADAHEALLAALAVPERLISHDEALDVDRLREAARLAGLPREVTVSDLYALAAAYEELSRE